MDGEQSPAPSRPPRRIKIVIPVLLGIFVAGACWFALTRDPFPRSGADTLKAAVAVKTWDQDALVLADGRRVPIPGLKELPQTHSVVLRLATRNGIEPQPDGRVLALLPVYSKWGAEGWHPQFRVDLSRLLLYTEEGIPDRPLSEDAHRCLAKSPTIDERGYEAQEFLSFRAWNDLIDQHRLVLYK
jgi:hypothetical protein